MNYPENTTYWQIGAIVLHDADAKEPRMFMQVIGYTKDGCAKTRYIDTTRNGKKIWTNEMQYLHAPEEFGIGVGCTQNDFDLVKYWNRQCGNREKVQVIGGCEAITFTQGQAFLLNGVGAWINTEDCGMVDLSNVRLIKGVVDEINGDGY